MSYSCRVHRKSFHSTALRAGIGVSRAMRNV